jgi:hypothetical protein
MGDKRKVGLDASAGAARAARAVCAWTPRSVSVEAGAVAQ